MGAKSAVWMQVPADGAIPELLIRDESSEGIGRVAPLNGGEVRPFQGPHNLQVCPGSSNRPEEGAISGSSPQALAKGYLYP
jgi:hypothetical protein